jgi:hypothetical protein
MANGNGRSEAPKENMGLPRGLSAWFAVEEICRGVEWRAFEGGEPRG